MKRLLFIWAICIQVWVGNSQSIRYVKPVSSGTGDGSSWSNASHDLQAMINSLALIGGQVWVAQGTYYPLHKVVNTTINKQPPTVINPLF